MAKKKKHSKHRRARVNGIGKHKTRTRSKRRSRMNGTPTGDAIMQFFMVQAGYAAAQYANKIVPDSTNRYLVGGAKLALGLGTQFIKNPMIKSFGMGVGVSGTSDLLVTSGLMSGTPAMKGDDDLAVMLAGNKFIDVPFDEAMNGNEQVLAGNQNVLAGVMEDLGVINGDLDVINGNYSGSFIQG